MAPSSSNLSKRPAPKLEDLLHEISQEAPAGTSLRYDPVYDEIRLARQEDDPRLSMGIWKTELKRADWNKIETLCVESLVNKSKDIQIAAWLTEAWTSLDGLEGYTRGIQLISQLTDLFWANIHPLPLEDGDMDNRYLLLEWIDSTLSTRLLLIPLTQSKHDQSAFGLGFYKSAQHGDAAQRRDGSPSETRDSSKRMGTLEDFQRSMDQTPDGYLSNQQSDISMALESTQALKDKLFSLVGNDTPTFSKILGALKEMDRINRLTLQARQPPPPPPAAEEPPQVEEIQAEPILQAVPEKTSVSNRHDVYRQLEMIASLLEELEPHSLVPQILRQLIRWENKNMTELFSEIASTPQEYEILMKILGTSQPEQ